MKKIIVNIIAVGIISGLIWYFFGSINNEQNNGYPITAKPNYSENTRTIKQLENEIIINFEQCTEDLRRIDFAFGSSTIEIKGKTNDGKCQMNYGAEVENPSWIGNLTTRCLIPVSNKTMKFSITSSRVNFASISQFCSS